METYIATLIGVAVAATVGLLGFVWSGMMSPTTVAAKIWDRIYMLDQALMAHPDAQLVLIQQANRTTPYFYGGNSPPHDASFVKVKALVYMHLNVFEEVYLTANSSWLVRRRLDAKGWEAWILFRMRHPLLREVFEREWGQYDPQARFDRFIQANEATIRQPCGPAQSW